ncbi:hypothetical protein BaRGS_00001001, partial [Batillaria attramentaria]
RYKGKAISEGIQRQRKVIAASQNQHRSQSSRATQMQRIQQRCGLAHGRKRKGAIGEADSGNQRVVDNLHDREIWFGREIPRKPDIPSSRARFAVVKIPMDS